MFGFFKSKNYRHDEVPEWAGFLNLDDFNKFIYSIEQNFQNKKVDFNMDKGVMEVSEVFGNGYQLGLSNLAGMCYQLNKKEWKKTISEHFQNLSVGHKFEKELEKIINDFTAVSKYIALRVWPKNHVEGSNSDKIIYREHIEGLVTALVFDLPTTVRSISIDEIKNWNVPLDELFVIGMKNTINNYPVKVSIENINEKPCFVFSADHFFVATYANILSKYTECIGKYGTIVSFPHRHAIIAYPINGDDIITSINTLMTVTTGLYKEGPGSISSNIYWYNNDNYLKLPYEITDDSINFYPPDDYINMLEQIMKDNNK